MFFPGKDPVKQMKRQATEWEKIFSNLISNKGLATRICIFNYQISTMKKTQTTQLENEQKICRNILSMAIYRWQTDEKILNIISCYGNASSEHNAVSLHTCYQNKIVTIRNVGEDVEKLGLSCTAGGNVLWYSTSGKQFGIFLKNQATNHTLTI